LALDASGCGDATVLYKPGLTKALAGQIRGFFYTDSSCICVNVTD
jgi:hypothetical protein